MPRNDRDTFLEGCKALKIELSDEKLKQIDLYAELLRKWSRKINIIGPETIPYIYSRHILDSIQVVPFINDDDIVLDVGAGAGLPSIIISIMTEAKVFGCERVGKKIQFMQEVRRKLSLESFFPLQKDAYKLKDDELGITVVTSRAFSELKNIIDVGEPLLKTDGRYVLLKGGAVDAEIKSLTLNKNVTIKKKKSITFADGNILLISR